MTAVGTTQGQPLVILDHKSLEAVFTKHMKALEQSWIFVGVKTNSTGELVLQLLEELLGYVVRFCHRGPQYLDIHHNLGVTYIYLPNELHLEAVADPSTTCIPTVSSTHTVNNMN